MTEPVLPMIEIAGVQEVDVADTGSAVFIDIEANVALLVTIARAKAKRDGLEPALEVLAAAIVESGCAQSVQVQLLRAWRH